jgi:cysteine desulfurase
MMMTPANIHRPIYLDYQATTPTDQRVVDAMLPWFTKQFGNPHSRNHAYGWEAEEAIDIAREHIASLINADPKEIIFTSGATESNNLALKGVAHFNKGKKNHIITTVTEHKCVLDSCRYLEEQGFDVTYIPVNSDGLIDINILEQAITPHTMLVSVMAVNNEIGVIQPLVDIGAMCRKHGVYFHTDAAQAMGKIPLDVGAMNIDLMSISGHKLYGPKGIGALYIRKKPRVRLSALIHGGGQERGFRSGTLPTPLCVGLGEACRLAAMEMDTEHSRLETLRNAFLETLQEHLSDIYINGSMLHRIPGNLNISFAFVEGESLMMGIKDLAVSSGSACTSASLEPSYVLRALGVTEDLAHTSIRFGFGRYTTKADIDVAASLIIEKVNKLRALSPLWEMVKEEGIDLQTIQWAGH